MLSELYESTIKNKERIIQRIEELEIDPGEVHGFWSTSSLDKDLDAVVGAEDGSMNRREFKGSVLYAVDAEALIFDGKTLNSTPLGEVGVFSRQPFIENRLRLYMSLYEFKASLKSLEEFNPDLFLLDGSLISELVRSLIPASYIPPKKRRMIEGEYLPKIKSTYSCEEICVTRFRDGIEINMESDIMVDPHIYLEYMEYLLSIQRLLGYNPVGVSKTSSGSEYFSSDLPDIILFEKLTKSEGYSKPMLVSIDKTLDRLPITHKFFDDLKFTIFYARLEDNKGVLKFEVPGKVRESEIIHTLSILKAISTEGYPYLLKKAHNDVVITNRDMDQISGMLGVFEKTGREIL